MLFVKGLNPLEQLQLFAMNVQCDMEFNKIARANRKAGFIPDDPADTQPENKASETSTESKEEAPKTEEERKAEAEAPTEPAGAERQAPKKEKKKEPTASTQASSQPEAAMNGGATQAPPNPAEKVNVTFDFAAMAGEEQPPAGPQGQPIPQQPGFGTPQVPPEYIQNPMLYYQYLQQMAAQQQAAPGFGRHKADNPQPPKPQVQKAEADNVQMDGLNQVHAADVVPPPPPKEWPQAVSNPLPQPPAEETVQEVKFDNTPVTSQHNLRYMAEIEKIALELGYQVQMVPRAAPNGNPDGLITVVTYQNGNPHPIPQKGFTIDTGFIIDRRAKMFPAVINYGYESVPAYQVLIPDSDSSKKNKMTINRKLFEDFFKGGVQMLDERKSMYSPEFRELNAIVSLITMPTNNMNRETRKSTQNRLVKAMQAGVFAQAKQKDQGSRFMFKSYDKKTGEFVLTNVGVPIAYDGPIVSSIPIEIHFESGGTTRIIAPKEV